MVARLIRDGLAVVILSTVASAQRTQIASVDSGEVQGPYDSWSASISADGRFVVFQSDSDLDVRDTNGLADIYLRDRRYGTTALVSIDMNGGAADDSSHRPMISRDGGFVVFASRATDLVAGDTNGKTDVFVRDLAAGITTRVSVGADGSQGKQDSQAGSVANGGNRVAFYSANAFLPGDTGAHQNVYVRDHAAGTTLRASVGVGGADTDHNSTKPSISADGNFVAFESLATNLVASDTNNDSDIFVRDLVNGITWRSSVATGGAQADTGSYGASISADGLLVSYWSGATDLVAGDTNGVSDIFLSTPSNGPTVRVSMDEHGHETDGPSYFSAIAPASHFVAFASSATNLVPGDSNGLMDVFVRDLYTGKVRRSSVDSSNGEANGESIEPSISNGATLDEVLVAYESFADDLIAQDASGHIGDIFVTGRPFTLSANQRDYYEYEPFELDIWEGLKDDPVGLVLTDVNGQPTFFYAAIGAFDVKGHWTLTGDVPSGLAGLKITLRAYGIDERGKLGASDAVDLAFH